MSYLFQYNLLSLLAPLLWLVLSGQHALSQASWNTNPPSNSRGLLTAEDSIPFSAGCWSPSSTWQTPPLCLPPVGIIGYAVKLECSPVNTLRKPWSAFSQLGATSQGCGPPCPSSHSETEEINILWHISYLFDAKTHWLGSSVLRWAVELFFQTKQPFLVPTAIV